VSDPLASADGSGYRLSDEAGVQVVPQPQDNDEKLNAQEKTEQVAPQATSSQSTSLLSDDVASSQTTLLSDEVGDYDFTLPIDS